MPLALEEAAARFLERPKRGAPDPDAGHELRKFVAALGPGVDVGALSPGQIEDYAKRFVPGWSNETDMARALRSNTGAQAHLRTVQAFLRWLHREGLIPANLASAIKLPTKSHTATPEKNLFQDKGLRLRDKPASFYRDTGLTPARVRLGIDFGTSNTSVALFDGRRVILFPIDPANYAPQTCRSLLYMRRAGGRFIGKQALKTYFADNTDRPHHWVRKIVGQHEYYGADLVKVGNFYLDVDEAEPGRFFESLKTGLRTKLTVSTLLLDPTPPRGSAPSGVMYNIEDLIGEFLAEVKQRAEAELGGRVDSIYLGRPVHFSAAPEVDSAAAAHLEAAARSAGFEEVIFEYEPVAAALNYELTLTRWQHVLVFDFGGGTLDVTVMRLGGGAPAEILSLDGVPIGGDDLDSRIMEGKLPKYFGQGLTFGAGRQEFPHHILERITRWQTIRELDNPRTMQFLSDAETTATSPRAIRALRTLIVHDLALPLYEEIERAKIDLSNKEETTLRMFNRDIAINERITRAEFERLITNELAGIGACVDRVVAASGLSPDQIDVVLRTGGSSSIPAFVHLLESRFGAQKIRKQDVFTGIAAGLSIAGWRSLTPLPSP